MKNKALIYALAFIVLSGNLTACDDDNYFEKNEITLQKTAATIKVATNKIEVSAYVYNQYEESNTIKSLNMTWTTNNLPNWITQTHKMSEIGPSGETISHITYTFKSNPYAQAREFTILYMGKATIEGCKPETAKCVIRQRAANFIASIESKDNNSTYINVNNEARTIDLLVHCNDDVNLKPSVNWITLNKSSIKQTYNDNGESTAVIVKANLQANPDGLYRSGYVDLVYNGNKRESIRIAQSN